MPADTIATLLEAVRVALEDKRRVRHSLESTDAPPGALGTLYMEDDPAFNALRALVSDKVVADSIRGMGYSGPGGPGGDEATAYWEAASNKALEGALIGAVADLPVEEEARLVHPLYLLMHKKGDTKVQALKTVLEWLKGEGA